MLAAFVLILCAAAARAATIQRSTEEISPIAALDIALKHAYASGISIKDIINLSEVNKEFRQAVENDESWIFVKTLREEPCFSSFAENAYYIPAGPRASNSTKSDSSDRIKFVFVEWEAPKRDGIWWDGERFYLWQPDFTKQEEVVVCLDRVLSAGLDVEFTADSPSPTSEFLLGEHRHQYELDASGMAKQLLLWIAIKYQVHSVYYYLTERNTQISWRHVEVAAENKLEDVIVDLIYLNAENKSTSGPWPAYAMAGILEHFEPSPKLLDFLLKEANPLNANDFYTAARYGRQNAFTYFVDKALQFRFEDQDVQIAVRKSYYYALEHCNIGFLDMLLNEYQVMPTFRDRRTTFVCAIELRRPEKAVGYFEELMLHHDFDQWMDYFNQDEYLSEHVMRMLKQYHDPVVELSVSQIVDELMTWPLIDIYSFESLDALIGADTLLDDGDEVSANERLRVFFLWAIRRGNYEVAKRVFPRLDTDWRMHYALWDRYLNVREFEAFFNITKIRLTRWDMLAFAQNGARGEERFRWALQNVNDQWTLRDLSLFERIIRENYGPTIKHRLQLIINDLRRGRKRAKLRVIN